MIFTEIHFTLLGKRAVRRLITSAALNPCTATLEPADDDDGENSPAPAPAPPDVDAGPLAQLRHEPIRVPVPRKRPGHRRRVPRPRRLPVSLRSAVPGPGQ